MRAEINKYRKMQGTEIPAMNAAQREALIMQYAPFVKKVAERLAIRLPSHIQLDELVSAGYIGLCQAIEKYDAGRGFKFRTYAERRIRGAMLDELRARDWVPRSVRQTTRRIEDAVQTLETRLGRSPRDDEIAAELGVDPETYFSMLNNAAGINMLRLDDPVNDGTATHVSLQQAGTAGAFEKLQRKEIKQVVTAGIKTLSRKEQLVVSLYYFDELTMKEIAQALDLTESRICQIHAAVMIKLRSRLKRYFKGDSKCG